MATALNAELGEEVGGLREALSPEWVNIQFGPPEWYEDGPTGLRQALEAKIAAVIDGSPDVALTPELRQAVRTVIEQWVPADLGGPNALAEWPFGDMQLGRAVDALAEVVSGVQKAKEAAWHAEQPTSNAA